jgi:hypothetical protein
MVNSIRGRRECLLSLVDFMKAPSGGTAGLCSRDVDAPHRCDPVPWTAMSSAGHLGGLNCLAAKPARRDPMWLPRDCALPSDL